MKINIHIIAFALLLAGVTSCIDDESGLGGNAIPELTVAGDVMKMQVLNFDLGRDCVIRPDISYKGGKEENLTYTWSIGTYDETKGKLEVVSHERNLTHFFNQGGTYYAHLDVTDGLVGYAMDYQVNINRTFEEGYILVSADEVGNGNMAFVKVMTPEEIAEGVAQVYMDHCLERMNEGVSEKGLIGVNLGSMSVGAWPDMSTLTRIMVSVADKCYFINLNTFTILSEIDYSTVFQGFKATNFVFSDDTFYPFVYDDQIKKFVHFDMEYMFGYEYGFFRGFSCDDVCVNKYAGTYYKMKTLFLNYNPAEVVEFEAGYATFNSTLDLLANEELLAAFTGGTTSANLYDVAPSIYILTRSTIHPNTLSLYTQVAYGIAKENFSKQECELTDDMALPVQGTRFVASPNYSRHFYAVDNCVYVMLTGNTFTLPKKADAAIRFPANEVVTYMDVNIDTEELYVATYDTTTKRGNFYIYNTGDVRSDNQTSPAPKAAHMNCADKITSILYKPRI